ncbi:MAG: MipA/OmpV family protein [Arenicella sp.]|nr:MipA/OmpV family protein [Arenicella sp.]
MTIKNCVFKFSRGLVLAASSVFVGNAFAEDLPLWELGLGVGALHQPYYPGSDQTRSFVFPVPVPVYRGKVLKSDDEGIRAELIDDGRYTLDMSLDFNLAIDSDDVDLRTGMDDIDSLLQIGPSLEVMLAENDRDQWLLNLPVRVNFEIGSNGLTESGYTFAPNISYFHKFEFGGKPWRASAALGPQFGSRDYQNVFYGVDPQFATDDRPAYQASSGYSGSRLLLTMRSKDKDRLWLWFLRYDNISGATFDDSPLVERDHGLSVGLIYSRFLFKSKKMVKR